MDRQLLKDELVQYAKQLGFPIIKIATAEPIKIWEEEVEKRRKLDPMMADGWGRMVADPGVILADATAIVVAVWPHIPYQQNFPQEIGRYSAHYREYPRGREAAIKLGAFLKRKGYDAVEDPPLPAKAIAHQAGIGYFGKNGIIHIEGYGSWITLHCILTNAPLPPDESVDNFSDCGECQACVKACPTGAIQEGGVVLPGRCIRNYMLSSDFIPVDIREKIGTRMLGCDICQQICPHNKESFKDASLPPQEDMAIFNIREILQEWKMGLGKRMKRMGEMVGKNYARAQKVLSMAVIIAGNTQDCAYIPLLNETLYHPHPPIRGHSAWALGLIGGAEAMEALVKALEIEKHPQVIREIQQALRENKKGYL